MVGFPDYNPRVNATVRLCPQGLTTHTDATGTYYFSDVTPAEGCLVKANDENGTRGGFAGPFDLGPDDIERRDIVLDSSPLNLECASPSASPSRSASASPSGSPSFSASYSPSASPSLSPSVSVSISPSASESASPSPSVEWNPIARPDEAAYHTRVISPVYDTRHFQNLPPLYRTRIIDCEGVHMVFHLKRRDTRPVIEVELLDPDGAAHDLTGADSATLHAQLPGGVVSREMTIDANPALGIVRYTWLAEDWTGTPPLVTGRWNMEYEVVGPGAARLTWPNTGYDELRIHDDLGQAEEIS